MVCNYIKFVILLYPVLFSQNVFLKKVLQFSHKLCKLFPLSLISPAMIAVCKIIMWRENGSENETGANISLYTITREGGYYLCPKITCIKCIFLYFLRKALIKQLNPFNLGKKNYIPDRNYHKFKQWTPPPPWNLTGTRYRHAGSGPCWVLWILRGWAPWVGRVRKGQHRTCCEEDANEKSDDSFHPFDQNALTDDVPLNILNFILDLSSWFDVLLIYPFFGGVVN